MGGVGGAADPHRRNTHKKKRRIPSKKKKGDHPPRLLNRFYTETLGVAESRENKICFLKH